MKSAGVAWIGNDRYFMFLNSTAGADCYMLYTDITQDDRVRMAQGLEPNDPVVERVGDLKSVTAQNYFVGAVSRSNKTGQVRTAGKIDGLTIIIDAIQAAKFYKFAEEEVNTNVKEAVAGKWVEYFSAESDSLTFFYAKENSEFTELSINDGYVRIQLKTVKYAPKLTVSLREVTRDVQSQISKATLEKITYEDLQKVLDMSWYRDDSGTKKDYRTVENEMEFEAMLSSMLEDAVVARDRGKEFVVALDTETTGTMIFELSKDNPALDHCVAISISWKDNQAYVIFTDMEYFQNVSAEYCFGRLEEVFTEHRGDIKIRWSNNGRAREEVFDRDLFDLVGQNSPFDRRVSISEGHALWFDDDTLNMAFNINPKIVRGNNGLKNLTRRLFGHETPELSDVLGKGNEDKYRYLADKEVAAIYAGADADYTRLCFFPLRDLLGPRMYQMYRKQDVKMLNILAVSEYKGLTTDDAGVKKLAVLAANDLQVLRETAYKYVGAYMDFNERASVYEAKLASGMISEEEFVEAVNSIEPDPNASYTFEFKASDLRHVMFEVLKYPIKKYTDSGLPKVDKYTRKKLLQVSRGANSTARKLQRSVLTADADYAEYARLMEGSKADKAKAKSMELINVDEFNSKEYPLALILEKYADLNKEYTSYFEPILKDNLEGRLFKTYSLARIETRRIQNPSQTMKKRLKKLILPYNKDYYYVDFDLSQIELRLMYSLSPSPVLIEKMKNPEADGHTENAAMVNQKEAYMVLPDERKAAKSVSFGVPYGLGERSLCETIFGDQTEEHLFATRMILYKWRQANAPIVALLEKARAQALEVVEISDEKRRFMDAYKRDPETKEYLLDENGEKIPIPLGAVYNHLGFCRYFDLSNIDQSKEAKARRASGKYTNEESTIRRAAGNYPIQSYAAEFFRLILYRFYDRCKKEGIVDKIIWNMLIHDELLCSVHKSINPFFMYKIIKESCMITMPGHTKYFVGINVGDNWKEAKEDEREAPVFFVDRMIKRYDAGEFREQTWFDHPWDMIKPLREQYVSDRIYEEVKKIQTNVDTAPIDTEYIMSHFKNYTVKAYVRDYPINSPVDESLSGDDKDNAVYSSRFESWCIERFGEGRQFITITGEQKVLKKVDTTQPQVIEDDFMDDDDNDDCFMEDTDIFDFDSDSVVSIYFADEVDDSEPALDDVSFDYSRAESCTNVAQMEVFESKYKNLKVLNGCVIINLDNDVQEQYLKSVMQQGNGNLVLFKTGMHAQKAWKRIADSTDLVDLDQRISRLRKLPHGNAMVVNDKLIIKVNRDYDVTHLCSAVQANSGRGYKVYTKNVLGAMNLIGQVRADADLCSLV